MNNFLIKPRKYTSIMCIILHIGHKLIKIKNYLKEGEDHQMIKEESMLN